MKDLTNWAIAAVLGFKLLSTPAQAKVVVNYDQFSDETTVSIVPEKIEPKRPQLSMSQSFRGKKPTKEPLSFGFGLQVHQKQIIYAHRLKCNVRIRVMADGKAARNPPLPSPLREIGTSVIHLAWENINMVEYLLLIENFQSNVFQQIVRAKTVKYRLCDSNSEVFELTNQEKSDLKKFYSFFAKK